MAKNQRKTQDFKHLNKQKERAQSEKQVSQIEDKNGSYFYSLPNYMAQQEGFMLKL